MGVYYDVAYDRSLAPPAVTTGNGLAAGACTVGVLVGTTTEFDEGIDRNQNLLNGGAPGATLIDGTAAAIDPQKLIRDPSNGCNPVYPWNFVRDNTIFGIIHAAGGYTAWADKHPSYSSVGGPGDGTNVNDYYSPEINSAVVPLPGVTTVTGINCSTQEDQAQLSSWTDSFVNIQCYDQLKVNAILHEIKGKNHLGTGSAKIPNLLGMNFQVVSVGQKLLEKVNGTVTVGGYLDAAGTPSAPLLTEIAFADKAVGEMVQELKNGGLYESTLVVITAKHGQSPIDPTRFFPIPGHSGTNGGTPATILATAGYIPNSESPLNPTGVGATEDDVSLLWLNDSSDTEAAVALLESNVKEAGIGQIFFGGTLHQLFDTPGLPPNGDPRTPDIAVAPNVGVVYTASTSKESEHGGFAQDDTNAILLLSNPAFSPKRISVPVGTIQVAPTILKALGLDPSKLDSVRIEGTPVLPGVSF
jgi:hypothetical protein